MSEIICNATPLIAFSRISQLSLLQQVVQRIVIPQAVADELLAYVSAQGVGSVNLEQESWIQTRLIKDRQQVNLLLPTLDLGEAEVIALALENQASLVLMDELTGRQVAQSLGLKITGSIGLLIRAKQQGLIPAIKPLIEQMQQAGLYYSNRFIEMVLRQCGEN